ncbi:MAG TPA: transposase, partial [Ktedonobacteraceae bacterium]|nr:transposase [Ktedonobacteraceae bacterium]
ILVEEDLAHLPQTDTMIGADLGLKSFVVLSDGEVVGNPRFFQKDEKKLGLGPTSACQEEKRVQEPQEGVSQSGSYACSYR